MTPEEKISSYFRSVHPDTITYQDGYYTFYLDVFGINISIRQTYLEEFSVEEIIQIERTLLDIDEELAQRFRRHIIRRY